MTIRRLLKSFLLISGVLASCSAGLYAQEKEAPAADHSYKPLTVKLNEDGSKYIRFIVWHQLWLTSNNLEADDAKLQVTPSIRRSRFLAYTQISPRFLILTHFGLNNLTPGNATTLGNNGDSPQLFLHDAWGEIMVNQSLYIGAGLHYWRGLTRLNSQSTLNFMTLDQSRPFTAWHSLGVTDQFARHIGIYAKGEIGKLGYRVAWNSPNRSSLGDGRDFGSKNSGLSYTGVSTPDANGDPVGNSLYEGYFHYSFWDTESTKLPYFVGTYFGKKKIFNIGAGFFLHPNGMYNASTAEHENASHFAVDAFLDVPAGPNNGLNAYAAFQRFNYGENYVSRWAGTGNTIFAQVGYYIGALKIMPYIAYQNNGFDGLDDNITATDIGINYLLNGHNCKLTLEYHRIQGDVREAAIATGSDAMSEMRLQLHVFL